MSSLYPALAAMALLPAMTGVPPGAGQRLLTVMLCNGGSMVIPMGETVPAKGVAPCCAKGCRSRRKERLIERNDEA